MIWEIAVMIVALAFAVLVYFIIDTLKSLKSSLDEVKYTMVEVKQEITTISSEVKGVVNTTNQVAADVNAKLHSLNILFDSVNDVGQVIKQATSAVKHTAAGVMTSIKSRQEEHKQAKQLKTKQRGTMETISKGVAIAARLMQAYSKKEQSPKVRTQVSSHSHS